MGLNEGDVYRNLTETDSSRLKGSINQANVFFVFDFFEFFLINNINLK